jgi:hypothetical protein
MASRKQDEPGAEVILLLIVLVICAACVFLLPIVWLYYELRSSSTEKPVGGFGLRPDEYEDASLARKGIMLADALLGEVKRRARDAGCTLRSDGYWDERKSVAKELNAERARLESDLETAQWALQQATRGPTLRFEEWHYYGSMAWAARAVMVSLAILFVFFPNLLTEHLLGPFLDPDKMLDALVAMGMASVPALIVGGIGGAIGWTIGSSSRDDFRPAGAVDLMQEYEAKNTAPKGSRSGEDTSSHAPMRENNDAHVGSSIGVEGADELAELSEEELRFICARCVALALAHLFWADGEISGMEQAAAAMIGEQAFPDILDGADSPDAREQLQQIILNEPPPVEVVQGGCELLGKLEQFDFLPGFLVGLLNTAKREGLSREEQETLVEVLQWMNVDEGEIEELLMF